MFLQDSLSPINPLLLKTSTFPKWEHSHSLPIFGPDTGIPQGNEGGAQDMLKWLEEERKYREENHHMKNIKIIIHGTRTVSVHPLSFGDGTITVSR